MALIVSLGIILSATLTPLNGVIDVGGVGAGSCDFSRIGLAPLRELRRLDDTSLNVLLFVPLGISLAFLPRTRRTALLITAAIALPFAIETIQLLLALLDRGCQSADVIDNLTGLAIGFGGGLVAAWLAGTARRPPG
jgi:glycopeptide antibiotics resistance protein